MHSQTALGLLAALAMLLPACEQAQSPTQLADKAFADLGRSDYPAAVAKFERALAGISPSDPQYLSVKLGEIEAWCYVDETGTRARDELLTVADSHPGQITSKDLRKIAFSLAAAGRFEPAIDLLKSGKQMYPKDPSIDELGETLAAKAENAGVPEATRQLKTLGYIGK